MDLAELDFEDIGSWPTLYMAVAVAIAFIAVIAGGYFLFTQAHYEKYEKVVKEETKLKDTFKTRQKKAANLEGFKAQMVEMEKRFGTMLKQLPKKTEVADLLVEVSQTGLSNGLEFSLFQPRGEVKKEFYAELPIAINVKGSFHQFGGFASEIAALPRIVTIHDVVMVPKGETELNEDQLLEISLLAKTYRYLDDDEDQGSSRKVRKR